MKDIHRPIVLEEDLPNEPFEKETLLKLWNEYRERQKKEGKQNIASVMQMQSPELKDASTILFSVANDLNKVEMTREMEQLLPFLRNQLKHHSLTIQLKIKETIKEDAVYSPQEKYQHLKKINPAIETLRKGFDLDF